MGSGYLDIDLEEGKAKGCCSKSPEGGVSILLLNLSVENKLKPANM